MRARNRKWVVSGGIGSGKSAVRRYLEAHGATTIDADQIGHRVLEADGLAFPEVSRRWPEALVGGVIDRGHLASIVFSDPGELADLEAITHPHIFDTIRARVQDIAGLVAVEVPLLYGGLGDGWKRLVVDCDDTLRVERGIARGMEAEDVQARIASQPTRYEWLASADVVVPNNGTEAELEETLDRLLPFL